MLPDSDPASLLSQSLKPAHEGRRDGSVVKSMRRLLFRRSRVQIPATTWWLTTIRNEI
ncbi:mCG140054 [Mus musculus]|nr:mCG140054 [Mus musculus]